MREVESLKKPLGPGTLRKDVPRGTGPVDPKAEADGAAGLVGQNLTEPVECPECHGQMVKAGTFGVIYHKPNCSKRTAPVPVS